MTSLKEIGRICGISESTVSKALKGDPKIKLSTRSRVQEVALQYNYHPNAIVRSLQTGRSMTIGVAYNDFRDSFSGSVMTGIMECLNNSGYEAMIICWDMIVSQGSRLLSRFSHRRVDGLILFPMAALPTPEYLRELRNFHKPIVMIDQTWTGNEFSYVGSDNVGGAVIATEHLIRKGVSKIGFLRYSSVSSGVERWQGFQDAMRRHSLPVKESWCADVGNSTECEPIFKLLSQPDRPDGLVCFNDYCAFQSADVAQELGIRIPEDLSIVGFGDLAVPAMMRPRLSSINQFPEDMGRRAANILLDAIAAGDGYRIQQERMPVKLISRESVKGC